MTKAETRIEILKVIFRRDQNIDTVITDAKTVEKYVLGDEEVEVKKPIEREPSKAARTVGKTTP